MLLDFFNLFLLSLKSTGQTPWSTTTAKRSSNDEFGEKLGKQSHSTGVFFASVPPALQWFLDLASLIHSNESNHIRVPSEQLASTPQQTTTRKRAIKQSDTGRTSRRQLWGFSALYLRTHFLNFTKIRHLRLNLFTL
jgi:hypothetical protein